ncbi:hypothetical protein ACWN8V_01175 [Vagococcus elongatus]|uniref:Uncharacterized protein n=1 Tax=Vagococcus elongatus TaxID=180344 RepID=A0A430B5X0_9ENTE|nr:hypothetical protein [Vagococcus elongatus]RSU15711.1 hypothetical protein CBF29_01160 [Vagococcus elongatus]
MDYHMSEGLAVIAVTLVLIVLFLFLTRQAKWLLSDKILLLITGICYLLDTIWWLFYLDYPYTAIYFQYKNHTLQLTVFFVIALVSFVLLIINRCYRLRSTGKNGRK